MIGARRLCPVFWLGVGYFAFNRYLYLFLLAPLFNRRGVPAVHCGGAGGDVYLNGRGLKPVSGHGDTGIVNRAREYAELRRTPNTPI